jgi:pyruvate/2-oxoglutarate dehydrogenase complex dihydrolipoamide acyltransferase (E2) component
MSENNNQEPNATAGAIAFAKAQGIDIKLVVGRGEGGRIRKNDVEDHIAAREEDRAIEQAEEEVEAPQVAEAPAVPAPAPSRFVSGGLSDKSASLYKP